MASQAAGPLPPSKLSHQTFPVIQRFVLTLAFLFATLRLAAQTGSGSVVGTLVDPATGHPVEFATFTLKDAATHQTIRSTASNAAGAGWRRIVTSAACGPAAGRPRRTSPGSSISLAMATPEVR